MARLKQLRLEKEAAEASTSASKGVNATEAPRARPAKGVRDNPKASLGRTAKSTTENIVGLDHAAKGQRRPLLIVGSRIPVPAR